MKGTLHGVDGTFSGELSAATGTFAGDLNAAGGTFAGNLSAAGGTFKGELSAATGKFKGIVQAAGFQDLSGRDMLNDDYQFTSEYLDVLGLNVGNGNLVIDSAGNISMKGDITMTNGSISWDKVNTDPVASNAASTAASAGQGAAAAYGMASAANTAAVNAETIARQIAAGTFSGGTFIDGTKIYSPEIYTNTLALIPRTTGGSTEGTGGLLMSGYFNSTLYQMFRIHYASDGYTPWNYIGSPAGAYVKWNFSISEFGTSTGTIRFFGNIDFTKATVSGINDVAVFA
jgi:hypothetical protein